MNLHLSAAAAAGRARINADAGCSQSHFSQRARSNLQLEKKIFLQMNFFFNKTQSTLRLFVSIQAVSPR